jgi:hypothetical protein
MPRPRVSSEESIYSAGHLVAVVAGWPTGSASAGAAEFIERDAEVGQRGSTVSREMASCGLRPSLA